MVNKKTIFDHRHERDAGGLREGKVAVRDTAEMGLAEQIIDFSIFQDEQKYPLTIYEWREITHSCFHLSQSEMRCKKSALSMKGIW